jgi:hypothetical protein
VKSENSRVFTDDLNGGPGWTWTTDLALIRMARLGFTTYKTAGTAKNTRKSYKTSHVVGWIVGWKKSANSLVTYVFISYKRVHP